MEAYMERAINGAAEVRATYKLGPNPASCRCSSRRQHSWIGVTLLKHEQRWKKERKTQKKLTPHLQVLQVLES